MEIQTTERQDAYSVKIAAEENGEVRGWAILLIVNNDRHAEPWGIMENVYVEPAFRGAGIGSTLISALIDEAKKRGCYKLIGWSRHSKPEVHELYTRYGFKNWGIEFRIDLIDSKPLQAD